MDEIMNTTKSFCRPTFSGSIQKTVCRFKRISHGKWKFFSPLIVNSGMAGVILKKYINIFTYVHISSALALK